jgi:hypothetical protein
MELSPPRDIAAHGKVKGAPRDPARCEVRRRYHRGSGSVDVVAWDPRQKNRAPWVVGQFQLQSPNVERFSTGFVCHVAYRRG